MSALQSNTCSSDVVGDSHGYGFAEFSADVRSDPGVLLAVRAAIGILVATALIVLVAGVATQSAVAMIGGGIVAGALIGALVALARVSAKAVDG